MKKFLENVVFVAKLGCYVMCVRAAFMGLNGIATELFVTKK